MASHCWDGSLALATIRASSPLRSLDVNGALGTMDLGEDELRRLCPNLEHLDARGRRLKY